MERKEKIEQDINQLINEPLVNDYEPSFDFVDKVMAEVGELENTQPKGKMIQLSFRIAAAVAVIFFLSNGLILLSTWGNSSAQTDVNDWTGIYEQQASASWYEYYNDELFLADNE